MSKTHKELVNKPTSKPASIPSKKANVNMYSGRGHDTVGPALYNPILDHAKKRAPVGDFQTSKTNRKVFEPTIDIENKQFPPKDNPGPGAYEFVPPNDKRQFNSQGN